VADHETWIETTDGNGIARRGYNARCECGWIGPMWWTRGVAVSDAKEHERTETPLMSHPFDEYDTTDRSGPEIRRTRMSKRGGA